MLDFLRRAVKSWVAQVLLALLVVSFAVWGIEGVGSGFSTRVATVGDQVVEADAYASQLRREQQRYGLDATQIRPSGLDRFVLARMVREAAFDDAAGRLGLSAPDEAVARQVRAEPAFQVGGQFDAAQYQAAVRRGFRSVADYEETVRGSLASGLVMRAAAAASAPPGAADAMIAFAEERRRFEALTLSADDVVLTTVEPTDAELAAHLEANAAAFTAPETRRVSWLHIDPAAIAPPPDEAELRALYEARLSQYATPERRSVDQIVYPTLQEAQAARARLDAGDAGFDALLAERGLSRADATLGLVASEELTDARGPAAFGLDAPGVAGPAQTATGFAVLDVTAIEPAVVVPFEQAREELAREVAARVALPEADRLAEAMEDLRAGGAGFAEVAQELGIATGTIDAVGPAGPAPENVPVELFVQEAFAAREGAERDRIRLPDGGYLVVAVEGVAPARTPALDEIRDAVRAGWQAERRRLALREQAEALATRFRQGETLEALAAETGAELAPMGPLRRRDPDPRLGEDARAALFAARPGAAAVSVGQRSATVAVLREVLPPENLEAAREAVERAYAAAVAEDQLELLGRALEQEAGVAINPGVVESVLSQIGA